jgi:hypothetical protein
MRLVNLSVAEQVDAAHQVLTAHATALAAGAIITVERRRVRIRLPN